MSPEAKISQGHQLGSRAGDLSQIHDGKSQIVFGRDVYTGEDTGVIPYSALPEIPSKKFTRRRFIQKIAAVGLGIGTAGVGLVTIQELTTKPEKSSFKNENLPPSNYLSSEDQLTKEAENISITNPDIQNNKQIEESFTSPDYVRASEDLDLLIKIDGVRVRVKQEEILRYFRDTLGEFAGELGIEYGDAVLINKNRRSSVIYRPDNDKEPLYYSPSTHIDTDTDEIVFLALPTKSVYMVATVVDRQGAIIKKAATLQPKARETYSFNPDTFKDNLSGIISEEPLIDNGESYQLESDRLIYNNFGASIRNVFVIRDYSSDQVTDDIKNNTLRYNDNSYGVILDLERVNGKESPNYGRVDLFLQAAQFIYKNTTPSLFHIEFNNLTTKLVEEAGMRWAGSFANRGGAYNEPLIPALDIFANIPGNVLESSAARFTMYSNLKSYMLFSRILTKLRYDFFPFVSLYKKLSDEDKQIANKLITNAVGILESSVKNKRDVYMIIQNIDDLNALINLDPLSTQTTAKNS